MAFQFDPDRVAYYEAAGWRAYYDRAWLRLMRLIVGLCQEQFRIPFPVSLLAGYYTVRASAARLSSLPLCWSACSARGSGWDW